MLEPTLEAVAAETPATVAKVDVDAHGELAAQFGVQGVPNLVFFRDGEPEKRVVGVQGKDALVSVVESLTA
jgi:thioredoxin 1